MNGKSFDEVPVDARSGSREMNSDALEGSRPASASDALSGVREIPAADAVAMHQNGGDVVYLDVRELHEWNLFRIPGAVHLPLGRVRQGVNDVIPPGRPVVVYCARGARATQAAGEMCTLGYDQVMVITGGVMAWVEAGGELEE